MKNILILTVVMGIGIVLLSQGAKAQVANNSNVNTPITATVGVNIPTIQTQNGMIAIEGSGGAIFIVGGAPVAPPPPASIAINAILRAINVANPTPPIMPSGVIIQSTSGAFLPGGGSGFILSTGARALFSLGDFIVR